MGKTIFCALVLSALFGIDGAWALCNPGTPNCVTAESNRPKPCNPCTIDGGWGSQCQGNGVTCGTGIQGTVNVYDPSERKAPNGIPHVSRSAPMANHVHRSL